jgi:hypothetical protein
MFFQSAQPCMWILEADLPHFVDHCLKLGATDPVLASTRPREIGALVFELDDGLQLHVQVAAKDERLGIWAHLEPSITQAPVAHALSAVLDGAKFSEGCKLLKHLLGVDDDASSDGE